MSKTIDQRVVDMQFNNKNFEKNVQQTMSTLDKLKQKLNLPGASKSLENIDSQAKKMNFLGLSNAVESVGSKFSALEVMGITALANITNSAVNAGKRIVSALTIDPIKTGFSEYETQINAVQTILANTSSKGTTLDDVNKALDTLNTYADKTIYNFTEMTRNIGTFTAAGVDLDTSVSAIQGIANLAAVSGSSSQQASTAMYQLSQALANGKVNLQDWNSVVNAGMGGEVFQNALKRTAKTMGTDVDKLIKKYGSFRESLTKGEWLTSEVLTKTLEQFTMAAEEGSEEWEKYKKSLMDEGYTAKQADEILKMANTATDAATKVKTFTQLWDTLKEAAQSGWTQTWEILVGDFEEAKSLLTGISNVVGDFINKSAQARNELLKGWKDAGGRTDLIESLQYAFIGITNIAKPIREAFREIFPPMTVEQLTRFTDKLKELTGRFADFTEKHGPQIKSTFKGIFSVLDIIVTVISKVAGGIFKITGSLLGFTGGILSGTASLGDWLSNIRDSIKETNFFGKAIDKVVGFLQNGIDKIKEFGSSLKESFKSDKYDGFVGFLKAVWEFIVRIGSAIGTAFGGIGKAIANMFGENSFGDVINTALSGGLLVGLFKFVKTLQKPLDSFSEMFDDIKDSVGGVKGILEDVRGCLQAYQDQLKAGTLLKIASAVGILAVSLIAIASIDDTKLGKALGAITALFGELMISMALFSKIPSLKGAWRAIPLMLSMATSLLILSAALKVIGSMEPKQMMTGLIGIAGGMAVLIGALHLMPEKNTKKAAKTIRTLSTSLLILSAALKVMGSMSWTELAKGLTGAVVGLAAMVAAVKLMPKDTSLRTLGMIGLATSLVILGGALKVMGSMSWKEIGKSLTVLAGSLVAIVAAVKLMPKNMLSKSIGLIGIATALTILGHALNNMSSMSWKEIGKGLTVLGGSLLILSVGLNSMKGTLGASASLLVAVTALTSLTLILKILGGMSWGSIVKSLVTLAGAFAVIGLAASILSPLIPSILGLAGALALLGVGTVAIGAGLALIGTGISILAGSLAVGATAIIASITVIITGLLDLIPTIASKLAEGIITFAKVIGDGAPQLADSLLKLLSEALKSLAEYTPIIADSLFELLIGVLDVLATRMPELITAMANVFNGLFVGVAEALKDFDGASLLKGAVAIGIMTVLAYLLAGISSVVGPAMLGLLGVGALVAELAVILAAIGGLAQIPGFSWLIGEGGKLLEKIGTAIGQFIGGIIGGIAKGFTSSLPDIATDLSAFMKKVKPFIDGAKTIDESVLNGVNTLVTTMLKITGANVVNSIASFLTGKNSLVEFGEQLVPFGKSITEYSNAVSGLDAGAIKNSASAAKALAEMASIIPNQGGIAAWFAGDNSVAKFGDELPKLGKGLKGFADKVKDIDSESVTAASSAAKSLAEMASVIPNEGGMKAWFTGDNSVAKFGEKLPILGEGLKGFSDEVKNIDNEGVKAASTAAKTLAEMTKTTPEKTDHILNFGKNLETFGGKLKVYFDKTKGINADGIKLASDAINSIKDSTSGLNSNSISSAATAITKLVNSINTMSKVSESSVTGFVDAMKKLAEINLTPIIDSFANAETKLKDAGASAINKLKEGIESKKSDVDAACTEIGKTISTCATNLKQHYQSFHNAGSYLAIGFANGINANMYRAKASALAMAAAAKYAAEEALGINSPSKVFYKIGSYVGEGFTNALGDSEHDIYNASSSMADTARKGISGAIGKVTELLNGSMNSQPTIRPILDLSDIESGVGNINGLFGNVGVGANLNAINASMNSKIQNGTNNDVVSAINKLRKDLGNVGGNTYNVNGVTYDDGSNIRDAVETIIRAAIKERRS